jgi:hypothetical protein
LVQKLLGILLSAEVKHTDCLVVQAVSEEIDGLGHLAGVFLRSAFLIGLL